MSSNKDYLVEDLLSESEKILNELGGIGEFDTDTHNLDTKATENAQEEFSAIDSSGQSYRADGAVEIRIAPNEMAVEADFYPPTEGMKPLSYNDVSMRLSEYEICYGIETEVVQEAVFKCNVETVSVKNIIIAKGRAPVTHVPEHYVIEEKLLPNTKKAEEVKGRVDYRKISPFTLIKKGDLIARKIPEIEGKPGMNVFGQELDFPTKAEKTLTPGKNTQETDNHVTSVCDGTFELREHSFYVNEVLQIQSDVNYKTGNIDFPGDVMISGQIHDGFIIKAGGSLYASETMDASEIYCENDLIVLLGIIGRNKGKVKVGGLIKAKFIENCYVEAGNYIALDAGIMNSMIFTSDKIILGKKGVIVGGQVHAQNGIVATQIGTAMGPRTELYCGTDYNIENKLKWIRDNTMKIAIKLNQVREQIKKSPVENPVLIDLRNKLQDSLHKLNETASSLVFKLDKNDNAEVIVRGSVFPGVYIEICHVSYVVNREMSRVRFKLDKKSGVIKVESI